MKVRNGFVSNSSSSSFIVAAADKDHTKIKITFEIDLAKYAKSYSGKPRIYSTIEELIGYFTNDVGYDISDLNTNESYLKAKAAIEAGKIVLCGEFSDQDGDAVETLLCENGIGSDCEKDGVEIIQSAGGY